MEVLGWSAIALFALLIAGAVTAYTIHSRRIARAAKFDLTEIDRLAERSEILDANGDLNTFGVAYRVTAEKCITGSR